MTKKLRIEKAIRWSNGQVMIFDEGGDQVGALQGRYEDVRDRVLAASGPRTTFVHASWRPPGETIVERAEW